MPARLRTTAAACLLAVCSVLTAVAPPALADGGATSAFISDTNSARANNGLPGYAVAGDLSSIAQNWAQWMAEHETLEHNPSLPNQACCWSDLAENVGKGSSESQIQRAFMNSSEHRGNILSSSYTQFGVGTAWGADHMLYVDEVFRRPDGSSGSSGSGGSGSGGSHASAPHVVYTPHYATRPRVATASRSAFRRPLLAPVHRGLTIARRLAALRWADRRAGRADAVAQAFDFVTTMRTFLR